MSRRAPDGGGWAPRRSPGPHTFRAALIVAVAVAVTVALLTQLGAGSRATVSGRAPSSGSSSHGGGSSSTTTTPSSTTTTTTAVVAPSKITLQVLNGLLSGTLSAQWSAKLHANPGYVTLPANNTTAQDTISTIYMVKSGYGPEARALARTVGLPDSAIVNVVPPPSSAPIPSVDRTEADLVLVIGQSLAGRA